jgi:hypothetical protein
MTAAGQTTTLLPCIAARRVWEAGGGGNTVSQPVAAPFYQAELYVGKKKCSYYYDKVSLRTIYASRHFVVGLCVPV